MAHSTPINRLPNFMCIRFSVKVGLHRMEWYNYFLLVLFCVLLLLFPLLPSASALLCIITAFIVLTILYSQKKRTRRLPPGPLSLPFIGHLHLLGKLPHQSLYELSKVHGPLMLLQLGSVPLLVASSPEMARQVLQIHDLAFADRISTAVTENIFGRGKDIGFSPPNAYWKLMRQLFATEIVSPKGLHFFKPVREEERRALMRSVLEDSADAKPQQMRQKLQRMMNDIIMRMMLGKRFAEFGGKQDLEGSHKASNIVELIEEVLDLLGMINVGDFFPCLKWMDLQGCERRSKRVAADLHTAFEGIINARRLANKDGDPPSDYLDVLLQASASSDTPIHFMEVIVELIGAGTHTIAISIEWVLAELLLNPEKMRILQEEIDKVVGRARMIEEEDIENLPFLEACVKETMRLHPVVPLLVPHMTQQACEIFGFHIPANTQAYVNTWAIGRDPKVWENSTKFSPERFSKANTTMNVHGQHFELLPFGSGRRICPGWRLGLLSVNIILASLIQGFEWSIAPSHHLDTLEYFHLNLCLASPLIAYTTPRLPKELY